MLLAGPFSGVVVRHGTSSRRRDAEVDGLVDDEWEAQLSRARAAGLPYDDNPVYRLEAADTDPDTDHDTDRRVVLTLAAEPYRVHAALKTLHDHPAVTEAHHDRTLVADGVVRTRDGAAVLVRLPKVTGTTTELVGSTCAPHLRPLGTGADLAGYLVDRVSRTLAVDAAAVRVGALLGLVLHEVGCVCAVHDVEVDLDLDALVAGHPTPEVLLPVPVRQLRERLVAEGGYLPAVADLLPPQPA